MIAVRRKVDHPGSKGILRLLHQGWMWTAWTRQKNNNQLGNGARDGEREENSRDQLINMAAEKKGAGGVGANGNNRKGRKIRAVHLEITFIK